MIEVQMHLYKTDSVIPSCLCYFLVSILKWNILFIPWSLGIRLIYMFGPAALGLGHIYQANPSWPWYNYYICKITPLLVHIKRIEISLQLTTLNDNNTNYFKWGEGQLYCHRIILTFLWQKAAADTAIYCISRSYIWYKPFRPIKYWAATSNMQWAGSKGLTNKCY